MNAAPTRLSAAAFATKAALLRVQRSVADIAHPIPRHPLEPGTSLPFVAAHHHTTLA